MRQYNNRLFWAFAFSVLICSTSGASHGHADEGDKFRALDAVWRTYDPKWFEVQGHWLVSLTIRMEKLGGQRMTGPQMLNALCKYVVDKKPGLPDGTGGNRPVFRVDLQVIGPNGQPVWPVSIPVLAEDGDCPVAKGGQTFFLKYPGSLKGWQFVGGNLQKAGEQYRRIFTFQPDSGSTAKLVEFNFDAACAATLKDPTVQSVQQKYEQQNASLQIDQNTVVIIAKQNTKQGVFHGNVYRTDAGKCEKQN